MYEALDYEDGTRFRTQGARSLMGEADAAADIGQFGVTCGAINTSFS